MPKIRLCSASRSARKSPARSRKAAAELARRISTRSRLASRGGPDLAFPPLDERVQRFRAAGVEGRRLVLGEQPLPDAVGALRRRLCPVLGPRLEVPPVRQEGLVERRL